MQRDKPAGKSGSTCPDDGKIRFYTRKDALRYASQRTRRAGIKLRAYRCGAFWHLTSQSTGELTWYRKHRRRPVSPDHLRKVSLQPVDEAQDVW